MIIGLSFIVVQSRYTFHSVFFLKAVGIYLQQLIGIKFAEGLRQSDDQFPCFNTFSFGSAFDKFLLVTSGKFRPIMSVCCFVNGIQIFLLGMAGYIGDPASDIMELAHSYKGMSLYSASSSRKFVTGKEVEDFINEWTLRCPKDVVHPLYEHNAVSGI